MKNDSLRQVGVVVQPSGLTSVREPGGKCVHGTYIPANSPLQDRSEFCYICNPKYMRELNDQN